jgi:hydrogenase-4 component B
MNVLLLLLVAISLMLFSGVPGTLLSARAPAGQRLATLLLSFGSLLGLACVAYALVSGASPSLALGWGFPQSRLAVAVDALSAFFLVPVFLIPMLGSIYGLGYWKQAEHPANGQRLNLAYGVLAGAMALVVIARDGMLFLIAWELMALSAYFAATAEDDRQEVRRAGWIYLIATHIGTLCLLAMFALWHHATGSFAWGVTPQPLPAAAVPALFVLALIGFGFKAGLMPLHVWLPGAHANAPSHVSAVMSGVMLKMGVYGLVRMTMLLPDGPAWWGYTVLAAGAATSVAGIAFAVGQRDIKRMLAYSSIENIGIIAMGLGLALLGRTLGQPLWILLGLGGALLHVWNHSLFKSLLFLNAGAVIHAAGTREIDRLGGLAKRMPQTAALFTVGAVAICALPPLNGFTSEWLLYTGLFQTLGLGADAKAPVAAVAAVALAMTGALAVACFVKLFASVFLGEPRRRELAHAHEAAPVLLGPMAVLAGACIGLGFYPLAVTAPVEAAIRQWSARPDLPALASAVPLNGLTAMGFALAALALALALSLKAAVRSRTVRAGLTWDCGYARPTARMQYTGSSLSDSIVTLTAFLLWPTRFRTTLRGLFPRASLFKSHVPDTVLDRLAAPLFRGAEHYLLRLRILQRGQTHVYILYILLIMLVLLIWGNTGR